MYLYLRLEVGTVSKLNSGCGCEAHMPSGPDIHVIGKAIFLVGYQGSKFEAGLHN